MTSPGESPIGIRRYQAEDSEPWNHFVAKATNATFLHDRGFMEYHADRFEDHSLIFENPQGGPIALLPANRVDDTLYSHGGLTYGGILVLPRQQAAQMLQITEVLQGYLKDQGLKRLIYKPSPHIFHSQPSEADLYALINRGARQTRADLGSAIPIQRRQPFSGGRKDGVRKARKAGLSIRECTALKAFWDILFDVLETRHGTVPTHSLDEMILLHSRFPDQIRLFASFEGEEMRAGVVLFDCGPVVHAQYIAVSPEGRHLGAFDLLVHHLLTETFANREWLSFGVSTTDAGRNLNVGLSRQKEMFGGHSLMFSQYQWDVL